MMMLLVMFLNGMDGGVMSDEMIKAKALEAFDMQELEWNATQTNGQMLNIYAELAHYCDDPAEIAYCKVRAAQKGHEVCQMYIEDMLSLTWSSGLDTAVVCKALTDSITQKRATYAASTQNKNSQIDPKLFDIRHDIFQLAEPEVSQRPTEKVREAQRSREEVVSSIDVVENQAKRRAMERQETRSTVQVH